MKYLWILFAVVVYSHTSLFSQNSQVYIQDQMACPNDTLYISVYAENVNDAGALSLFIGFDTLALEFISVENINPQLSGLLYNEITIPEPQVGVSWSGIDGGNFVSGKMFDLKFHYAGGSSNLSFNQGCEIANVNLDVLQINYVDGVVLPEIPITQDFELRSGWNSLATFIVPESLSLDEIFGSITGVLEIVSDGSNVYVPNGVMNSIGEFDPRKGYYLKVSEPSDFSISGSIDTLRTLNLSQGWNIFPVVSPCNILLDSIFDGDLDKIEAIVEIAGTRVFWPEKDIYSLHILETTKAYVIKVSQDFVFEIPECTE